MSPAEGHPVPLSVVVPLFNERDNIEPLVRSIRTALGDHGEWEVILVDDGSTDGTAGEIRRVAAADSRIRLIRLARNYGQTTALQAGFDHASGRIVVSMDGDLQNDPADIPRLVRTLEEEDYDLVAGYRTERRDSARRRLPSAVANFLARSLTGVDIRDTGCTLRAYRRELLDGFIIYSDMHRFIPAVAVGLKSARITEIPVRHQERTHGRSKYGISRVPRVLSDLIVLLLIRSFRERPLQMFARGAGWCIVAAVMFALPGLLDQGPDASRSLILPALPLIWLELACFLLLLGLIAEVVLRRHRTQRRGSTALVRGLS